MGRSAEGGELLCSGYRGEASCAGQGRQPLPRKSDACVRLYWVIDWRKIAVFQKLVTVFETKLRPVLKIFKSDCRPDPEKNEEMPAGILGNLFDRISENLSDKK